MSLVDPLRRGSTELNGKSIFISLDYCPAGLSVSLDRIRDQTDIDVLV